MVLNESGEMRSPWGLVTTQNAGPYFQDFLWAGLEQDLRIYIYSSCFRDHPWKKIPDFNLIFHHDSFY